MRAGRANLLLNVYSTRSGLHVSAAEIAAAIGLAAFFVLGWILT
jgi:hypothetical protein